MICPDKCQTQNCLSYIDKPSNLSEYFEERQQPPALMICPDKLQKQNQDLYNLKTQNEKLNIGSITKNERKYDQQNNNNCSYNWVSNGGSGNNPLLQSGYSKNIDLDSELKGINYTADKCFYDNRKNEPSHAKLETSSLYCHQNILVKDYTLNKENYQKDSNKPRQCGSFDSFRVCPNDSSSNNDTNQPVYYEFSNDSYCSNYPCQRLFNNITRRKTLTNLHNRHNINPKYLDFCGIKDSQNYDSNEIITME
jgi:hypothetical protein